MNYRHIFHAGNFADVFKHVLLVRMLVHLAQKAAAFRYLDTHAGTGLYDLSAEAAQRTGEWREGIGSLQAADMPADCRALLAPYLELVGPINPGEGRMLYPGSPVLAQGLARPQDRMTLCELHPEDVQTLRSTLGRDSRAKALEIDGFTALNAFLPPKERRGLVLVDPPFEAGDDMQRVAQGVVRAHAKWAGGIYAIWYPVKDVDSGDWLARQFAEAGIERRLRIELRVAGQSAENRLIGCGLLVINPPFTLAAQCQIILPELARILGKGHEAGWRIK